MRTGVYILINGSYRELPSGTRFIVETGRKVHFHRSEKATIREIKALISLGIDYSVTTVDGKVLALCEDSGEPHLKEV